MRRRVLAGLGLLALLLAATPPAAAEPAPAPACAGSLCERGGPSADGALALRAQGVAIGGCGLVCLPSILAENFLT